MLTDAETRVMFRDLLEVQQLMDRKIDLIFNGTATTGALAEIDKKITFTRQRVLRYIHEVDV